MRYVDRADAGRRLAPDVIAAVSGRVPRDAKPVVLGIPRGGVIVAGQIAHALSAECGVALARKIAAPHNSELAIGAIGEDGDPILDHDLMAHLGVSQEYLLATVAAERLELRRRTARYRGETPAPRLAGRFVVIVDDGIATGATLLATLETVRSQKPALLVCAVPVGAPDSVDRIASHVDVVVCPLRPRRFRAVGEWYDTFTQTTDVEVIATLQEDRENGR